MSTPTVREGLGAGENKGSLVAKMEQRGNRPSFSRLWAACQLSLLWPSYSSPWEYLALYNPSAVAVGSQLP